MGFNVLHPMGWDAFGLPAEQYAIKSGRHPREFTEENVARFKAQLGRIGFNYDWEREVNTTDPGYFKWTQWIFRLLYESWFNPATNKAEPISTYAGSDPDGVRLAFVSEAPVNWCPALGTVLANEEVVDGKSDVGGFPVERRPMRQWMLRITAYAERLINELAGLDWPDLNQSCCKRNWIGRSEGAHVNFHAREVREHARRVWWHSPSTPTKRIIQSTTPVPEGHRVHQTAQLTVFTTRPDTLFGATYMVLAPGASAGGHFCRRMSTRRPSRSIGRRSPASRTWNGSSLAKEKTGVFIGCVCGESRQRRAHSGVDRGLRAGGLRHGSDHGCAGTMTNGIMGIRQEVRVADASKWLAIRAGR